MIFAKTRSKNGLCRSLIPRTGPYSRRSRITSTTRGPSLGNGKKYDNIFSRMKKRFRKYGGIDIAGRNTGASRDTLAICAGAQDGLPGYRVETGASEDVPSYGYHLKSQISNLKFEMSNLKCRYFRRLKRYGFCCILSFWEFEALGMRFC